MVRVGVHCPVNKTLLNELGSKKDHHEKLNQGRIPEDDLRSFAKIFQQIPFILETPKNSLDEDSEQIRIFKQWFS